MRKKFLVQNLKSGYKKAVVVTVTMALVASSTYVYSTWASKEESTDEKSESTSESKIKDTINDTVKISSKDVDKDEVVYVISDSTGTPKKTIVSDRLINKDKKETLDDVSELTDITNVKGDETFKQDGDKVTWDAKGNDIYYQGTTTKSAPVTMKITYTLDGKEVTPEEIAGKSGKVKMRFDYTNNEKVKAQINGKEEEIYVPFVAITGMILGDGFSNIEVTNGKTVSDGDNKIVVGAAMPGLADSLDIKEEDLDEDVSIPDYFEVTADVKDFSLDMTMTVVANNSEFNMSNIDLSKLDEKINDITDATDQLKDGSGQLADGVGTLKNSLTPFKNGMGTLNTGIVDYTNGASSLADGIKSLNSAVPSLTTGVKNIKTGVDAIYDNFGTKKNSKTIRGGMNDLVSGTKQLQSGAGTLKDGTKALADGTKTLDDGAQSVAKGAASLNDGVGELAKAVNDIGTKLENNEKPIYAQLAESGIKTYAEAEKALTDAETLQGALIKAITYDTYTGLAAYGVTDSTSAAKLLGDITTKVNKLNKAVSSLSVMDQVASPLTAKADDIAKLVKGANDLKKGAASVAAGTKSVKENTKKLDAGAGSLNTGIKQVNEGTQTLQSGVEKLYSQAIKPLHTGVGTLSESIPDLSSGVKKLYSGSKKLVANNKKLTSGAKELKDGTDEIVSGVDSLNDGANELKDGIVKFNEEGIQKIVDAYNGDVKSFVDRINAVVKAGENYNVFTQVADGKDATVKFMIKTDAVKK